MFKGMYVWICWSCCCCCALSLLIIPGMPHIKEYQLCVCVRKLAIFFFQWWEWWRRRLMKWQLFVIQSGLAFQSQSRRHDASSILPLPLLLLLARRPPMPMPMQERVSYRFDSSSSFPTTHRFSLSLSLSLFIFWRIIYKSRIEPWWLNRFTQSLSLFFPFSL